MKNEPLLADLINAKRASGYDDKFERLLREPWYCPHCRQSKTLLKVTIPVGRPGELEGCADCGKVGIVKVAGDGGRQMLKVLAALTPFDRSGTA
jgi:hypothetical protein